MRLGLLLATLGCTAMPPTRTWLQALDQGLKEPAGTFATFRAAFCAGHSGLQYRCLSRQFLAELGIEGQFVFREFRDKLLEREPYLPNLLAKAEIDDVDRFSEREALVWARAYGRTIRVSLMRVDFWEIRQETAILDGDYVPEARELIAVTSGTDGTPVLHAEVPLANPEDGAVTTALEIGSEWKITGFEVYPPGQARP